jgi:ElaB/YqjD/DUF883 family membrane-anchored ribosome-binding protein
MFRSNVSAAGNEMKSMINEAERTLNEAKSSTGEKAEELRKKGLSLLQTSISKAQDLEQLAISSAKDAAASTDKYVHQNPWASIAVSGVIGAGIGLVLGMAISNRR